MATGWGYISHSGRGTFTAHVKARFGVTPTANATARRWIKGSAPTSIGGVGENTGIKSRGCTASTRPTVVGLPRIRNLWPEIANHEGAARRTGKERPTSEFGDPTCLCLSSIRPKAGKRTCRPTLGMKEVDDYDFCATVAKFGNGARFKIVSQRSPEVRILSVAYYITTLSPVRPLCQARLGWLRLGCHQ